MELNKETTVAFIGNKIFNTPNNIPDSNLENVIRTELQFIINDLINEGKHIFLTGMEPGFDMLAAEVVLEYAKRCSSVELYAVIPFARHEQCYSDVDRIRYTRIYEGAANHIYINKGDYSEESNAMRTEFMLTNSSEVIVYDSGSDPLIKELTETMGNNAWNMYDELLVYFDNQSPVKKYLQDYPDVFSFQYGREGLIFDGNNQPFPIHFDQIEKIERSNDSLCFFLNDGLKIIASLNADECNIAPIRISGSC